MCRFYPSHSRPTNCSASSELPPRSEHLIRNRNLRAQQLTKYLVLPVQPDGSTGPKQTISAESPEAAANLATGLVLKRGQAGFRATLRAKVYVPNGENTTLLRYY